MANVKNKESKFINNISNHFANIIEKKWFKVVKLFVAMILLILSMISLVAAWLASYKTDDFVGANGQYVGTLIIGILGLVFTVLILVNNNIPWPTFSFFIVGIMIIIISLVLTTISLNDTNLIEVVKHK